MSPFQLLAEAHQDGDAFRKSSDLLDYLNTPIGRIVAARCGAPSSYQCRSFSRTLP
jgi:hypothetical protein